MVVRLLIDKLHTDTLTNLSLIQLAVYLPEIFGKEVFPNRAAVHPNPLSYLDQVRRAETGHRKYIINTRQHKNTNLIISHKFNNVTTVLLPDTKQINTTNNTIFAKLVYCKTGLNLYFVFLKP